jgi:hypothetical protein
VSQKASLDVFFYEFMQAGRPKHKLLGSTVLKERSDIAIRAKIAKWNDELINEAHNLALNSKNEKTRTENLHYLIDKLVANAHDPKDDARQPVSIKLFGGGFVPPTSVDASPVGNPPRPPPIQSSSLAQKGKKNINSYHGSGTSGSTA